jgi:hypothetical protein
MHWKSQESGFQSNGTTEEQEHTMRGPALNGVNIIGFDVNRASLRGSIHRSGSNSSASGPQSALLRCVNNVEYQNVVDFGKYSGCRDSVG